MFRNIDQLMTPLFQKPCDRFTELTNWTKFELQKAILIAMAIALLLAHAWSLFGAGAWSMLLILAAVMLILVEYILVDYQKHHFLLARTFPQDSATYRTVLIAPAGFVLILNLLAGAWLIAIFALAWIAYLYIRGCTPMHPEDREECAPPSS